jgi:hypothetical protein
MPGSPPQPNAGLESFAKSNNPVNFLRLTRRCFRTNSAFVMKSILRELSPVGLAGLLILLNPIALLAGSATWNLSPASGDWNTPGNWTPPTVPNGPSDIATFESSNVTSVSLSSSVTLNGIVFEAGASTFTITSPSSFATFLINGIGISNNSGLEQTFVADAQ